VHSDKIDDLPSKKNLLADIRIILGSANNNYSKSSKANKRLLNGNSFDIDSGMLYTIPNISNQSESRLYTFLHGTFPDVNTLHTLVRTEFNVAVTDTIILPEHPAPSPPNTKKDAISSPSDFVKYINRIYSYWNPTQNYFVTLEVIISVTLLGCC